MILLCISKKKRRKTKPKAKTTQLHRLCHSMGSVWMLNRRKSRKEIKQRHCKQQWTVISPWCLLQFSRQQVDYHSPELRQFLGPYEFSYWTGWIFSAGVSVHCRRLWASDTSTGRLLGASALALLGCNAEQELPRLHAWPKGLYFMGLFLILHPPWCFISFGCVLCCFCINVQHVLSTAGRPAFCTKRCEETAKPAN